MNDMVCINGFRLGNWYLNDIDVPTQVLHFFWDNYSYEKVKAVVLDRDWLIKLGVKYHGGVLWLPLTSMRAELHFEVYGDEIVTTLMGICDNSVILNRIKYIHELQNLVYVLTGEELVLINAADPDNEK